MALQRATQACTRAVERVARTVRASDRGPVGDGVAAMGRCPAAITEPDYFGLLGLTSAYFGPTMRGHLFDQPAAGVCASGGEPTQELNMTTSSICGTGPRPCHRCKSHARR